MKKTLFLIFIMNFSILCINAQNIKLKSWSYVYSTPFYSWEKQGMSSPEKMLRIEKDSIVEAIGFYLLGNENRYVGDIKVKVNNTVGWMSSIIFNTDDVREIEVLNKSSIPKPNPNPNREYYGTKNNSTKVIKMEKRPGGTFLINCKVNELSLKFIFDTGASNVSISLTEALFMLKNGYLSVDDITGTEHYLIASGEIKEGTTIIIRKLEFGGFTLYNVEASVSHELEAPLLLGQSALSKLGKIVIDYENATLEVID